MPDTVVYKGKTYKLDPQQQHNLAMGVPIENIIGPDPGQSNLAGLLSPDALALPVGGALGAAGVAAAPFVGAAATTHPLVAALGALLGAGAASPIAHTVKGLIGGGGGGAKTPAATTAPPTDPSQVPSPMLDLLKQILGVETASIPQGYESFFKALGGGEGALMGAFNQQLGGVKGANPNMVANYMALNQAQAEQAGPQAQLLQQDVLTPLANQQNLLKTLSTALGYLPYTNTSVGTALNQALVQALGGTGTATPGLPAAAGAAPALVQ